MGRRHQEDTISLLWEEEFGIEGLRACSCEECMGERVRLESHPAGVVVAVSALIR
jgi:hypothetical protein